MPDSFDLCSYIVQYCYNAQRIHHLIVSRSPGYHPSTFAANNTDLYCWINIVKIVNAVLDIARIGC